MQKNMKNLYLIILIVVAVIAFGVLYWQYREPGPEQSVSQPQAEKLNKGEKLREERLAQVPERTKVVFKNIGSFVGRAEGRVGYHNNEYVIVLEADLPEPLEDQFYAAWLVQEKPFQNLKMGELTVNSDGLYEVVYKSPKDYRTHKKVVISLEEVRDDKPDRQVMEGYY